MLLTEVAGEILMCTRHHLLRFSQMTAKLIRWCLTSKWIMTQWIMSSSAFNLSLNKEETGLIWPWNCLSVTCPITSKASGNGGLYIKMPVIQKTLLQYSLEIMLNICISVTYSLSWYTNMFGVVQRTKKNESICSKKYGEIKLIQSSLVPQLGQLFEQQEKWSTTSLVSVGSVETSSCSPSVRHGQQNE